MTLRLNRWRFCEGYYNGKLDYGEGQEERTSQDVLTARDLLRYIAHRDPETNLYSFGEEELACLEETVGQLIVMSVRPCSPSSRTTPNSGP